MPNKHRNAPQLMKRYGKRESDLVNASEDAGSTECARGQNTTHIVAPESRTGSVAGFQPPSFIRRLVTAVVGGAKLLKRIYSRAWAPLAAHIDVSRTEFPFELDLFAPGVCGEEFRVGFRTPDPFKTMLKAFHDLHIKPEDTPGYLKEKNLTKEEQLKVIEENAAALMQQMAMAYRGVEYEHINARLKRGTASDAKVTNIDGAVKACESLRELGCGDKLGDNKSIIDSVKKHKLFNVYLYRPLPPVEQPKSWRELATVNGSVGLTATARLPGLSESENVFVYKCVGSKQLEPVERPPWVALHIKPKALTISDLGARLHLFSGESGSGKTVTSIASALESMGSYKEDGSPLPLTTRVCVVVNGVRDGCLEINDTTPPGLRNRCVKEYLENVCERIVEGLNVATLQGSAATVGVTLVFDECGPARNFRRGLCALYGRSTGQPDDLLLKVLPEKLRCTRVFLMTAGTGSELVLEKVGSLPTTFATHRVDCDEVLIRTVQSLLIQHVRSHMDERRSSDPVFAANLKSLSTFLEYAVGCVKNEEALGAVNRKQPQPQEGPGKAKQADDDDGDEDEQPHPVAQHIGRLMRNLRIASLFVTACVESRGHIAQVVPVDWREVAPEFMRSALQMFQSANGLKDLRGAKLQRALLDALGYALGGPRQSVEEDALPLELIRYGLLTDNAILESSDTTKATAAGTGAAAATDHMLIKRWREKGTGIEYSIVLPREYLTRFRMSIAVAELALRGFGSAARPSDRLGFEDTMRDFLMMHMMGACSRVAEISVGMTQAQMKAAGIQATKELYNCPAGTDLSCTGDPFRDLKCEIHQRVRAACRAAVEHFGPDTPLTVHFASLELSTPPEGVKEANKTRLTPNRVVATLLRELNRRPNVSRLDSLGTNPVLLLCAVKSYPSASAADVFAVSALIERDGKGDWRQVEVVRCEPKPAKGKPMKAEPVKVEPVKGEGEREPKLCVSTNVQLAIQCKYAVDSAAGYNYNDVEKEFDKMPETAESKSYLVAITNKRNVRSRPEDGTAPQKATSSSGERLRSLSTAEMMTQTLTVRKDAAEKWLAPVPIVLLSGHRNPWSHASELTISPVDVDGWKIPSTH